MLLALVLACAPKAELEQLQARVSALEAARAEDQARIEALEAARAEDQARLAVLEAGGEASTVLEAPPLVEGAHCTAEGPDFRLPGEGLPTVEALMTTARAIPHRGSDGEIDGYRISAIRRGSFLESCGFRNGDILHSIQGMPLTSPAEAEAARAALKEAPVLGVALVRRGSTVTLTLRRPEG